MTSESDCRLQTVDFFRLTIAATRTVNDWNAFTRNPLSSPFSFTDLPHPPPQSPIIMRISFVTFLIRCAYSPNVPLFSPVF